MAQRPPSLRVFVNNVDGLLGGAICADLHKLTNSIMGTRKNRVDALVPPFIKRIVMRTDVRKLLKAVASCDVVVYDIHDADLEELELVLRVLHSSEITHHMTFIIVSSVGVWGRTQRGFETIEVAVDGSGTSAVAAEEGSAEAGDGEIAADAEADPAATGGVDTAAATPARRPVPLRSEDYTRRIPAPKFQEWKAIETTALALREKGFVHPYIVCSGIPYGLGEDAFLGLMKAAWQSRDTLRYIGDGNNFIPCVHARDCARLVRRIVETKPELEYHLAVDRGDVTQKEILNAVASEFKLEYEVQPVTVPEALLAELADLLTLDLRFEPSPIMEPTKQEESAVVDAVEEPEAVAGGSGDEAEASLAATIKPPVSFRWWSERGIVANMPTVVSEFVRWRQLQPVRLIILGPPGSGAGKLVSMLAERYAVEAANMDDVLERVRNTESTLGHSLRDTLDQITAALSNPKSTGPFQVPTALMIQILDESILSKASATYRGFVLSGFPSNLEDASAFFLEDAPLPDKTTATDEASRAPSHSHPPEKVFKSSVKPDAVIVLASSQEACQRRSQEREVPMSDSEFQKKMAKWKESFPEEGAKLTDVFSDRGLEPLKLEVDDISPEDLCEQIVSHFEAKRAVNNFSTASLKQKRGSAEKLVESEARLDEGAAHKEAEGKRKKKEEEDRLEAIKKEEFLRLEKHSEPLRTYLMQYVVPTLTTGLIDVCRETPEDPVAYLADYLSIYSAELVNARRRKRQAEAAALKEAQGASPA